MNWINDLLKKTPSLEEMAHDRVYNLAKSLSDINPDVKEIEKIGCNEFKLNISSGIKYIWWQRTASPTLSMLHVYKDMKDGSFVDKVFEICLNGCPSRRSIWVNYPLLCNSAHITEEQIFLCLLEIENIINNYEEKSISEAHAKREAKFIERLAK